MNIDYSALQRKVTNDEIASYKKQIHYKPWLYSIGTASSREIVWALLAFFIFSPTLAIATYTMFEVVNPNPMNAWIAFMAAVLSFLGINYRVGLREIHKQLEKSFRKERFITENHIQEHSERQSITDKNFSFGIKQVYDMCVYRFDNNPNIEFGTYSFDIGISEYNMSFSWSYACVHLKKTYPRMLLDSVYNNTAIISNLPLLLGTLSKVQLEGNFSDYFHLYTSPGAEREAFYVFSPDIMQLLIDSASSYDFDICGDRLYIYHKKQLDLSEYEQTSQFFTAIENIYTKIK